MEVKIIEKPDFKKYSKRIKNISKTLVAMENDLIIGIIRRTQKGKDIDGKPFKKYSKNYDKKGIVNLTVTNNMLHDISAKEITDGVKLWFPTEDENDKAYDNEKRGRHFFGLDKKQVKTIKKRLIESIIKK